eukprot:14777928-Alexandrium_andersonii.AAC.1
MDRSSNQHHLEPMEDQGWQGVPPQSIQTRAASAGAGAIGQAWSCLQQCAVLGGSRSRQHCKIRW